MKRAPSIGTPSIYSHTTNRSTGTGLKSARSAKSIHVPWYKRPLIPSYLSLDVQNLSFLTAIFSVFEAVFTMGTSIFDLYCLYLTALGSEYTGYYIISFDFVYVGNMHVRNLLLTMAWVSAFGAIALLVTGVMLIKAVRREDENRMRPWLIVMLGFGAFRLLAFIFASVVNDMIFAYNIIMCLIWIGLSLINFSGWAIVYTLYLELADLTKLEDFANLRMGTMASLATQSMAGSRPTTPHSTTSTVPLP